MRSFNNENGKGYEVKRTVPSLLSFNAGYVDTAGFLALQGLFTAHVTGNFVTFGAALAHGTSGAFAKLLALPVFCVVVIITRIVSLRLPRLGLPILKTMVGVKVVVLILGASLMIVWGPFADADSWRAIVAGMTLVAAMAIQNAIHRVHLAKAPPTTLMTGTSTQIMLDVADLLSGAAPEKRAEIYGRLTKMAPSVGAFILGCLMSALLYMAFGLQLFILPPLIALVTLALIHFRPDPDFT